MDQRVLEHEASALVHQGADGMLKDVEVLIDMLEAAKARLQGANTAATALPPPAFTHELRESVRRWTASARQEQRAPHPALAKVHQYIEDHLSRPMDVSTLAGVVQLTPHQLNQLHSQTLGITLWQYVLQQRARRAAVLLADRPWLPLSQVARDSGFDTYKQFIATFRKHYGLLPSAFRRAAATAP